MIEISKFLGTMRQTYNGKKWFVGFPKNGNFYIFHMYIGHLDGTHVVPNISKSKNMMFNLSKALSNVLIRLSESNLESVDFWKISKFSFVGQNFQKSKSASFGRKIMSSIWISVLLCQNIIIYKRGTVRTCSGHCTQFYMKNPHFLENPQITFFHCGFAAWYPEISKFLPL